MPCVESNTKSKPDCQGLDAIHCFVVMALASVGLTKRRFSHWLILKKSSSRSPNRGKAMKLTFENNTSYLKLMAPGCNTRFYKIGWAGVN